MTPDDAKAWLQRFRDTPEDLLHDCQQGHKGCSIDPAGPCLDDALRAQYAAPAYGPSSMTDGAHCVVDFGAMCETCGGQGEIDVSAPDPEAPAQWAPCPQCAK